VFLKYLFLILISLSPIPTGWAQNVSNFAKNIDHSTIKQMSVQQYVNYLKTEHYLSVYINKPLSNWLTKKISPSYLRPSMINPVAWVLLESNLRL